MKNGSLNINWSKLVLELLVVFLGVTAGFVLNNWRSTKEEKVVEAKYIAGFLNDVTSDNEDLAESVKEDSVWLTKARPIIKLIQSNNFPADSAISTMRMIVQISKATLNNGTYTDIINSGNLNIINDFNLRTSIVEYQLKLEGIVFIDNYFYDFFGSLIMPFVLDNYDLLNSKPKDTNFSEDLEFRNLFAGYYSMVTQRNQIYNDVLSSGKELQKLLEKY